MNRKATILVRSFAAVVIAVALVAFSMNDATNCGGNSAALFCVQDYVGLAKFEAEDSPDHLFRIGTITQDQQKQLSRIAHYDFIPQARFLVSTLPLSEKAVQPRRIIIVCNTPFQNVPRRWLWHAPSTYAAGFSDGSIALISPGEFAALDQSSFKYLDELCTAN